MGAFYRISSPVQSSRRFAQALPARDRPALPIGMGAAAAMAAVFLVSCAESEDRTPRAEETARVFSAEDKRVARALSLGSNQVLMDIGSTEQQAARCRLALDSLAQRLQASGSMTSEMERGFAAMEQEYARLAGSAAAEVPAPEGLPAGEDEDSAGPDPTEEAQLALSCLRRFEEMADGGAAG